MAYCVDARLQKLIYSSVAAVVSICGQFTTVIMATDASKSPKAHWNVEETTALLDYLLQHISEAGDGGNFKPSTWTAVAGHLASAQLLTAGPAKTVKRCKAKWVTLKQTYSYIESYRGLSGVHWDNERGAGIEGEAAWAVWNTYLQANASRAQSMRQFHNRGWAFYLGVQAILPNGSGAQGHHAFYPAAAAPAPSVIDSVPDLELEESIELSNDTMPAPFLSFLTSHRPSTASIPSHTGSTEPQLPPTPHLIGSESSTGKRTHDALLDIEVSTFASQHPEEPLSSALASTTMVVDSEPAALPSAPKKRRSARPGVLMTSVVKASKITPATAVVGMQGSINRIGDILERAIGAAPQAGPSALAAPVTSTSEIRASTVLDRAMDIMSEEDSDLPASDLGMLMAIFSAAGNERAMEIYVRSPSANARRAYIQHLISTHMLKQAV